MFCHYLHLGSGIAVGYRTTNHTEVQEDSELNFKLTIATRNSPGITEPHNWSEVRLSLPLFVHWSLIVYGLNATDKLPANDWNATEVCVERWCFGVGEHFLCWSFEWWHIGVGILSGDPEMSFHVQYRADLRPSHTTTKTAKKTRYCAYSLQPYFTTSTICSTVLYTDNDFHNDLFCKKLFVKIVVVSLASVFLESR